MRRTRTSQPQSFTRRERHAGDRALRRSLDVPRRPLVQARRWWPGCFVLAAAVWPEQPGSGGSGSSRGAIRLVAADQRKEAGPAPISFTESTEAPAEGWGFGQKQSGARALRRPRRRRSCAGASQTRQRVCTPCRQLRNCGAARPAFSAWPNAPGRAGNGFQRTGVALVEDLGLAVLDHPGRC